MGYKPGRRVIVDGELGTVIDVHEPDGVDVLFDHDGIVQGVHLSSVRGVKAGDGIMTVDAEYALEKATARASPERAQDVALVSTAIKASGLSASAFARDILVRNPRAIFRMLAGEVPLSPVVRARCQAMIDLAPDTMATPPPRQKSVVTPPARKIPDPNPDGPIIIDLRDR